MKSDDFQQWLSGYLDGAGDEGLSAAQVQRIKEVLQKFSSVEITHREPAVTINHDKIARVLRAHRRSRSEIVYC